MTASATGGMRRGIRLGIDVGSVRVGVARSDRDGILATPVATLNATDRAQQLVDLRRIVDEYEPIEIIIGLPRHLSGGEGAAAAVVREYAGAVVNACPDVPVRLVDERLTTVSAHQALHSSGRPGRRHRAVVDQVAAVMILQSALDQERSTGEPAGEIVTRGDTEEARP